MYIYALYTEQPLPAGFILPCDGGSFGVSSHLTVFASSETHESFGSTIMQQIGPLCPALLVPITRDSGYAFCGSSEARAWLDERLQMI